MPMQNLKLALNILSIGPLIADSKSTWKRVEIFFLFLTQEQLILSRKRMLHTTWTSK